MNVLTTTWRQLVRRRLWPVALLLLAALVAVPVLLAREPAAPAPIAPVAISTEADDTIAEPVVAKVTAEDRDRRRRVLGARKDPFAPAPPKKTKAKSAQSDDANAPAPAPKAPEVVPSGGGSTPTTPTGGEPAPEKKYYSPGTIIVRFGDPESGNLQRFAVKKFEALPDEELPLLIYMGLTKNGKKAKFLVDAAVEVDGDGICKPHRSSCETIELAVGETEFLDVFDPEPEQTDESAEGEVGSEETAEPELLAQFQMDLVDIKRAGDDDVK
jgi:hypothetical protein